MIKRRLMLALDHQRDKAIKPGMYTYEQDGVWYVVEYGPSCSNTYRVVEHDAAGLALLLDREHPEDKVKRGVGT